MAFRVLIVGTIPEDLRRDLAVLEDSIEILTPSGARDFESVASLRPHLVVFGHTAPFSATALGPPSSRLDGTGPIPSLSIVGDPAADLVLPADGAGREQVLRLARRLGTMRQALVEREGSPDAAPARRSGSRPPEAFLERVRYEFSRAVRYRHPVSLVAVSIDGRDRLAASYGEGAVEEFLRTLEETLQRCVRDVDLFYRAGPSEFVSILPETSAVGARIPADRFLNQTSRLVFKPSGASDRPILPFKASSSIGIADGPGHGIASAEELIARARASMDTARSAGGSRVVVDGTQA